MYKINDFNIDWLSKDSHWLFDESRKDGAALAAAARAAPFYPAHIGLFTSGFQKAILLSKEAVLTAARAAVRHLHCKPKRLWHAPLPFFHIAGLALSARAFCGAFAFKIRPWKGAAPFVQDLRENKVSYTSLVPTQIYDLVSAKLSPPPSLEFALAGGDALSFDLFQKAKALGWPLLPTYGMTEAASQIATEPRLVADRITADRSSLSTRPFAGEAEFPKSNNRPALTRDGQREAGGFSPLTVLPHIQIRVGKKGCFLLKSPALLTGQFHLESGRFEDPKDSKGWFQTEDRGRLEKASGKACGTNPIKLVFEGRADDQLKVSGRLVSLNRLSEKLQRIAQETLASFQPASADQNRGGARRNGLNLEGPHRNGPTTGGVSFGKTALGERRHSKSAPRGGDSGEARDMKTDRSSACSGKDAPSIGPGASAACSFPGGSEEKLSVCRNVSFSDKRESPRPTVFEDEAAGQGERQKAARRTVCLVALPHKRKGREPVLAADFCRVKAFAEIVRRFNQEAPRAERVKSVYIVKEIPLKSLLKPDRERLGKQLLGEQRESSL